MSFQKLSRLNRKLLPRSTAEKSKPHFFQLLSLAPAFNSLVEKLLLQRHPAGSFVFFTCWCL
jgi:hypothetical protein